MTGWSLDDWWQSGVSRFCGTPPYFSCAKYYYWLNLLNAYRLLFFLFYVRIQICKIEPLLKI